MRKKIYLLLILLLFPFYVDAANANSAVGYDLTAYKCTNSFQDRNISTEGVAYFSHCIEATCEKKNYSYAYNLEYYSNEKVNCLNGNRDPYYEMHRTGCNEYQRGICNEGDVKYCSIVMKYDCSKKRDGTSFTTTTTTTSTKTTKRTTRRTTSKTTTKTTTTEVIPSNTKLKSLTLTNTSILFNKDVYSYNVSVLENVNKIEVTAIPEDSTSTVDIKGNDNIKDGSVIVVTVKGTDGTSSVYKIKVTKQVVLSSNNKLEFLSISGYDLSFDSNVNNYDLTVEHGVTELDISYETEDDKANVTISNNNNLYDGSKIIICVTAEDGSINDYIINVSVKEKSNVLTILFIIVIILALLAGGYYIYKRFIQNRGGEKYEYE